MNRGWRCRATWSLSLLFLLGCGESSDRRPLHGRVEVDGVPLAYGSINFRPTKGNPGPAANAAIEDGEYRFSKESGPKSGPHRVVIDVDPHRQPEAAEEEDAPPPSDPKAVGNKPSAARGGRSQARRAATEPATTHWELEYTVPDDGDDRKDFTLTAE